MNAVIKAGGRQFTVKKGQKFSVNRLDSAPGTEISFEVLALLGDTPVFGTPVVSGAKVMAKVLEHSRGKKVIVGKYKRRKGFHKKQGHKQELSKIEITEITA